MLTDPKGYMESVVRGLDVIANADEKLSRHIGDEGYLNYGVAGDAVTKSKNTSEGAYKTGMTAASIIPAIMINYYALALQTIKSPIATYQATIPSKPVTINSYPNAPPSN